MAARACEAGCIETAVPYRALGFDTLALALALNPLRGFDTLALALALNPLRGFDTLALALARGPLRGFDTLALALATQPTDAPYRDPMKERPILRCHRAHPVRAHFGEQVEFLVAKVS